MIRKLLIVAFVVSVAANSLAAVAPVIDGDNACGGCCRAAARRHEPRLSPSKLCCLTRCGQPGETQTQDPATLRNERDGKSCSPVVVVLQVAHSIQQLGFHISPPRSTIESTPIYLRTGTLLI